MSLISKSDLLEAGWTDHELIPTLLAEAADLTARGITDADYILKLLRKRHGRPDSRMRLRMHPAPLAEAITATNPLDEQNLAAVRRQMKELLRVPIISQGALMPDACPAGSATAAIPVGGVVAAENALIPSAHSEDICCSLYASFFHTDLPTATLMDALMRSTRFGPGGRSQADWIPHPILNEPVWRNPFLQGLERHAAMHLADQGDGNHFAFLGEMTLTESSLLALKEAGHDALAHQLSDGSANWKVLVTHHGSRGLGAHVFKRGQKAAEKQTAKLATGIPEAGYWLDALTETGQDYWEALQYVSQWTRVNHEMIHEEFAKNSSVQIKASFGNEHNFVWKRGSTFFHAKGATPAWKDESGRPSIGLIPLHMSAPILIVLGKNHPDFLGFAPHGAGRNLSRRGLLRKWEKERGSLDRAHLDALVNQQTKGLDVRWWHGKPDLTETPLAYKPADQIRTQIESFGLAKIIGEIHPLGCIMAGDAGPRPWARDEVLTPKQKRQIEHRAERRKSRQSLLHPLESADEEFL
jgi:tRNA-splicing ligase RtcB (3'-phosphate/5'-hydroxy nucleic acid ligase)